MVSSRQKGIRAERQIIEILSRETGLHWEQTPGSGSEKLKEIYEFMENIISFV
ncbi:MAG: hypothetical protein CM15mV38_0180 [uncultured marine virus]|nr:MAG: hypothetical protein CM15mV38_0180 [uncultured marine virus]